MAIQHRPTQHRPTYWTAVAPQPMKIVFINEALFSGM